MRRTIWVERQEPVLLLLVRVNIDQMRLPAEIVLCSELFEEYLYFFAVWCVFC